MRDEEFAALARAQFGAFHRDQVLALGHTEATIRSRLASRVWLPTHRRVYRLAAVPPSWQQDLMAACLLGGEGTYVSRLSAAAVWRLAGFEERPVEVAAPRQVRGAEGVTFRRVVGLHEMDRAMVGPLPVSNVTRTLIDLAAVSEQEAVEVALDDALRRGLTSLARINWRLDVVGTRGLRGVSALRQLMRERDPLVDRTESLLEKRFLTLLRTSRLPSPVAQYILRDNGKLIARIDFAYPAQLLAIELDGYRYHSGRLRWERDLDRRNRIESLGWRVINVTWAQLRDKPKDVVSLLARFFPEQRSLFAHGPYMTPDEQKW